MTDFRAEHRAIDWASGEIGARIRRRNRTQL